MQTLLRSSQSEKKKWFLWAMAVAAWTIIYNILEGIGCTWFGWEDESLTLFGFGVDSFIEVISGIGIFHLMFRLYREGEEKRDDFERMALRITGVAFFLLTAGLLVTAVYHVITGHKPETTFWGIVFSLFSIVMMWAMIWAKEYLGKVLRSRALLADAACSRVCIYMSVLLCVTSLLYVVWPIPYLDSMGTMGLAFLSFREGRECFQKAESERVCGCHEEGACS